MTYNETCLILLFSGFQRRSSVKKFRLNFKKLAIFVFFSLFLNPVSWATTESSGSNVLVYWAGWSNEPVPDQSFRALFLAFALLKKDPQGKYYTNYSVSGNFEDPSSSAYQTWNRWRTKWNTSPCSGKVYVAYGGETNSELRGWIINASDAELFPIAREIKRNLATYGFDGVDLDIEGWWNYRSDKNKMFTLNLIKLVKILRYLLDSDQKTINKEIAVTVGFTSAGFFAGSVPDQDYTGTMLEFYQNQEVMQDITFINIMVYGLGPNFYVKYIPIGNLISLYKQVVGENNAKKLIFGILPIEGGATTSPAVIQELASTMIAPNGLGGMFLWGVGVQEMGRENPGDYINAMRMGLCQSNPNQCACSSGR